MQKLPSKHQIDHHVLYNGTTEGIVIAIRFTKSDIYYDILNRTTGEVTKNVQEELVQYA